MIVFVVPIFIYALVISLIIAVALMLAAALAASIALAISMSAESALHSSASRMQATPRKVRTLLALIVPAVLLGSIAALMVQLGTIFFNGPIATVMFDFGLLVVMNALIFMAVLCTIVMIRNPKISAFACAVVVYVLVLVPAGFHPFGRYNEWLLSFTSIVFFMPTPSMFLFWEFGSYPFKDVELYRVIAGWLYLALVGATIYEAWRIRWHGRDNVLAFRVAVSLSLASVGVALLAGTKVFGLSS